MNNLDVFIHQGDAFGMDCGAVGFAEDVNHVGLRCILKRQDRLLLKAQIGVVILSNLSNKPLEGKLSDKQVG